jgi:hypothetical protein
MRRIGEDLRRELGRFGTGGEMAQIVTAWPASVGEEISRNAWPARLARDRTLHVNVSSSAWSFELTQLEGEILARLKEALEGDAPARLRFAPGPLPELGAESVKEVKKVVPAPSSEARAEAARIAAEIEDEGLREVVARAAAASLSRAPDDRSVW